MNVYQAHVNMVVYVSMGLITTHVHVVKLGKFVFKYLIN